MLCKNWVVLTWISLLVWVDKENSLEFPFDYCTLLIHFPLFITIYKVPYIPFHPTALHVWSSEANKNKNKNKININLAILPSYDTIPLSRFLILRILHNLSYGSWIFPILLSFSVHSLSSNSLCSISSSFSLIVSMICCPLLYLPFHCLQFFSSLPQYSLLYLLSVHPHSFLVVNLPSNSSLASIPLFSSLSCFCISFIFLLYSLSNSSTTSLAFSKFSSPFHVSKSAMNPFYHTKYLSFLLTHYLFRIFSISYFSFPSTIIRAGCFFFCPVTCPAYIYSTHVYY